MTDFYSIFQTFHCPIEESFFHQTKVILIIPIIFKYCTIMKVKLILCLYRRRKVKNWLVGSNLRIYISARRMTMKKIVSISSRCFQFQFSKS